MADKSSTMESVVTMFANIYKGKKVLVTGHTGFKGSWLCLWLNKLGADVYGVSLPTSASFSHYNELSLKLNERFFNIKNITPLKNAINDFQPEIIFHLAAQPLVRRSYLEPIETWNSNLVGTMNLLEVCRSCSSVTSVVVVTTDKVYENKEEQRAFVEGDKLLGDDPYSASKAACEVLVHSYRKSFFAERGGLLLATARAGNVIGGGDWADDRLIPDIVRSVFDRTPLFIRYPNAIRPWQHVLDSLSGYLLLGQKLLEGKTEFAKAWNFGPSAAHFASVEGLLEKFSAHFSQLTWQTNHEKLHEAGFLTLDSQASISQLNWQSIWQLNQTIEKSAMWFSEYYQRGNVISEAQLDSYIADANKLGVSWC